MRGVRGAHAAHAAPAPHAAHDDLAALLAALRPRLARVRAHLSDERTRLGHAPATRSYLLVHAFVSALEAAHASDAKRARTEACRWETLARGLLDRQLFGPPPSPSAPSAPSPAPPSAPPSAPPPGTPAPYTLAICMGDDDDDVVAGADACTLRLAAMVAQQRAVLASVVC